MNYLVDTGFVIKRVNSGEADKYITLFTKNHGKVEAIAKGVRKISSRRASSIELLNLIRFQAVKTRKNYVLTEVALENSFEESKKNLRGISTIFFLCELLDKLCQVNQKHPDIYKLLEETIEKMNSHLSSGDLFQFQVQLVSKLGFWDQRKKFEGEEDLRSFIEGIIERKIKTKIYV